MTKKTRSTAYDWPAVLDILMRHDGAATVRQLTRELGISTATFHNWMKEHVEFADFVRELRAGADDNVVASLYDRAVGYTQPEQVRERNNAGEMVVTKEIDKHYQPDVGAAKLWLTNRRPDEWADKRVIEDNRNASLDKVLLRAAKIMELDPSEYSEIEAALEGDDDEQATG